MVVNHIQTLLETFSNATIGILTAYTAQRKLYLVAKEKMRRHPVMTALDLEGLYILSWGKSQGKEFDYVLMDILTDDRSLGFQRDEQRMNVATGRARNGLIIVADVSALTKQPGGLFYACDLVKLITDKKVVFSTKVCAVKAQAAKYPDCRYHVPSQNYGSMLDMPLSVLRILAAADL